MPRKPDAMPIGTAPCLECGTKNAVFQNAKNYLYMRGCPGCGSADQRISDKVQTRLFYSLETGEGAQVDRPRNVPETRPDWLDAKPAPAATAAAPAPVNVPSPVPSHVPEKPAKKGGGWLLVAGFLGLLGAAIGIITNTNTTPRVSA